MTHTSNRLNAAEATGMNYDLKTEPDENRAASLYTKKILRQHESRKPLFMTMDVRMYREDQDRDLLAFYKQTRIEWASPVKCKLEDDIK